MIPTKSASKFVEETRGAERSIAVALAEAPAFLNPGPTMSNEPPKTDATNPLLIGDLSSDEAFETFVGQQAAIASDEEEAKRIRAHWFAYRARTKPGRD